MRNPIGAEHRGEGWTSIGHVLSISKTRLSKNLWIVKGKAVNKKSFNPELGSKTLDTDLGESKKEKAPQRRRGRRGTQSLFLCALYRVRVQRTQSKGKNK
jgi:hypothetical protein